MMKSLLSFSSLFLLSSVGYAGGLKISTAEHPPYCLKREGTGLKSLGGIFGEVLNASLKGDPEFSKIQVDFFPWKRAQEVAQSDENTLVFPYTRTPAREPNFQWVNMLVEVNTHVYTLLPKTADTLDEVKKLGSLGALAGSPPESESKKIPGMENKVSGMTEEGMNLSKLMGGRIDGWVTQNVVSRFFIEKTKTDSSKIRPCILAGAELFSAQDVPPLV